MYEFVIKYWLQMIFGGIVTIGAFVIKFFGVKINKRYCEHDTIKSGLLALLRSEIIKSYHYYMDKEYCPLYARDSIIAMGVEYKNLGGNGLIPGLLEEINDLPTDKKYIKVEI